METSRIPTTDEMDEILTEQDREKKGVIVLQCRDCKKWTEMKHEPLKNDYIDCDNCNVRDYDTTSIKSVRSYNPLTDLKRKPK